VAIDGSFRSSTIKAAVATNICCVFWEKNMRLSQQEYNFFLSEMMNRMAFNNYHSMNMVHRTKEGS